MFLMNMDYSLKHKVSSQRTGIHIFLVFLLPHRLLLLSLSGFLGLVLGSYLCLHWLPGFHLLP